MKMIIRWSQSIFIKILKVGQKRKSTELTNTRHQTGIMIPFQHQKYMIRMTMTMVNPLLSMKMEKRWNPSKFIRILKEDQKRKSIDSINMQYQTVILNLIHRQE